MLTVIALLVGIIAGAVGTWVWLRTVSASRLRLAEDKRRAILLEAERESETTRREVQIEAREHAVKLRAEIEAEIQDRRVQIAKVDERAAQRASEAEGKLIELTRREQGIADRETHLKVMQDELKVGQGRDSARAAAGLRLDAERGEAAGARALRGSRAPRARPQRAADGGRGAD